MLKKKRETNLLQNMKQVEKDQMELIEMKILILGIKKLNGHG